PSDLRSWARIMPAWSLHDAGGTVDWNLAFEKNLSAGDGHWRVRGKLNLADAKILYKKSGTRIDALNAAVSFRGTEARIENATLRVGSSRIAFAATVPDLAHPRAIYTLRSNEISLADVPAFFIAIPVRLKNFSADGEVQIQNGAPSFKGTMVSSEGNLKTIPFGNLRADIVWLPTGIELKQLSLQAFNGTVRSEGIWFAGE